MRFCCFAILLGISACTSGVKPDAVADLEQPGLGPTYATLMTEQECLLNNGRIIGDIGDGRIHRSDYLCPNGNMPLGSISYEKGDAIATEGAVCCSQ